MNSIMHRAMLTESEQRFIQNCYSNTINKVDEIVRQTAWVLSNMTKYTSLVLSPNINAVKLKHIQLVPVTEGKALVVIVTDAGSEGFSVPIVTENSTFVASVSMLRSISLDSITFRKLLALSMSLSSG